MAYHYIGGMRDQQFLMPVDMADWLDEGHLAWFIIDVVERIDTSSLHALHPNDGAGRIRHRRHGGTNHCRPACLRGWLLQPSASVSLLAVAGVIMMAMQRAGQTHPPHGRRSAEPTHPLDPQR